jgi:hypothetical protein
MDCRNKSGNDNFSFVITALVAVIHRNASGMPTRAQSARFEYR